MAQSVSIENVSFGYGSALVLNDVNLSIKPGEYFCFLGPSGSGKTTLLRLVAGFGTPSTGRIKIGERDVTHLPPWERNLGMVFQSYALWPHMTVAKNVAFGLERRKVSRAEINRKVQAALERVGLAHLADRRPAQLSGGQQQRVALARTLVIEPSVLLLDEPLSNLDAKLRTEMRIELKRLQRELGITTIYVTHDQEEANAAADRIAVLDGGIIQQIGTPVEMYDHPANRFVAAFLGTANLIEGKIEGGKFGSPSGFTLDGISAPAGPACVSIRPQHVTVGPAGKGIPGVVEEREFLGETARYRIKSGNHRLIVDEPHRRDFEPREVGADVGLVIDTKQVSVLHD
jgi:iron(III) transport system ATP-binding protein